MLEKSKRERIIALVNKEVVPAIGCTEPMAVALCTAKAAATTLGKRPERIEVLLSPNTAYCSFENFRQIYHLQRGVQSRFGVPVYLALLTMSPAQNADPAETGSMMEQLGELIHKSLRQCDAMARYSENQYVLLISGNSSAENGSTPLERIKAAFYRMPAHGRYLLNYHMYAPELHALSADARRR